MLQSRIGQDREGGPTESSEIVAWLGRDIRAGGDKMERIGGDLGEEEVGDNLYETM